VSDHSLARGWSDLGSKAQGFWLCSGSVYSNMDQHPQYSSVVCACHIKLCQFINDFSFDAAVFVLSAERSCTECSCLCAGLASGQNRISRLLLASDWRRLGAVDREAFWDDSLRRSLDSKCDQFL